MKRTVFAQNLYVFTRNLAFWKNQVAFTAAADYVFIDC